MQLKNIFRSVILSSLLFSGFAAVIQAQTPRLYATTRQLQTLLNRIETQTNAYQAEITRNFANNDSRITNREDRILDLIADFENATNTLKVRVNQRQTLAGEVDEVYNRATLINNFMLRNRLNARAESLWASIRNDLNTLSTYYRLNWRWDQPVAGPINGPVVGPITSFPISDRNMRNLIRRIETKTNTFRRQIDRALDSNRLDGTPREDEMNSYIAEFEDATNRLIDRYNNRQSTSADASEVLNRGLYIDRFMRQNTFSRPAENQWRSIRSDLDQLARNYRVSWNWNQVPSAGWNTSARLEGTYRLNRGQSDNVSTVIDVSLRDMNIGQRNNVRRNLETRLASPEMIAIDTNGTEVSMATSNSAKVVFIANGVGTQETNPRGRIVTTTASLTNGMLKVNYDGDRVNDFHLSFEPFGANQLRVTKRLYLEGRNEMITINSVYDRVSRDADWVAVNSSPGWNDPVATGDFYVPNGVQMTARLENAVNTKASQPGDRFRMTVISPAQYRNAVIEGRIVEAENSGRFSGRANLSMAFDTITTNGRTYRFSGIIDKVAAANGDSVTVNNEGTIRDSSQTNKTVTRAGIGAVLGAIVGAIAGGGDGAAIGAGIGAGAGAGTVLIAGSDSIELGAGSTFDITATAPPNRVGRK
jgi:hypothetical protein